MSIIDKPIVKTLMLKGEKGDPGDLDSSAIVDNLTTNRADKVLSAKQGKILNEGKVQVFDTVADMKEANLKVGMTVQTKGYYEVNDGGGANYHIKTINSETPDNAGIIDLQRDNLIAIMIVDNNTIDIRQLGYKANTPTQDCHDAITQYINLCNTLNNKFKLFIPTGVWAFSPTEIYNQNDLRGGVWIEGMSTNFSTGNNKFTDTIIVPYNDNQDYIWLLGISTTSTTIVGGNTIHNIIFSTDKGSTFGFTSKRCRRGLILNYCCYSHFDCLYFHQFKGTGLTIRVGFENYFGYMNFRGVGFINLNETEHPWTFEAHPVSGLPSGVSAMYVDYVNFEGWCGSAIYIEPGATVVHCEFNNIQAEWNIANNYWSDDLTVIHYNDASEQGITWDNPANNIEHMYIVKGAFATNYNGLQFNTISVSGANNELYTVLDSSDNIHRHLVRSGVFGTTESYESNRYGLNCSVSKISLASRNDDFPAFHSVDLHLFADTQCLIGIIDGTNYPFMINQTGARNKFVVNSNNFNHDNKYYLGNTTFTRSSLNDGSGINNLVGNAHTTQGFDFNFNGRNKLIVHLYIKADSYEDITSSIVIRGTITRKDGTTDTQEIAKITQSDIQNNIYPLKTWFDFDITSYIKNRIPVSNLFIHTTCSNPLLYIDYFQEISEPRILTANDLSASPLLLSGIGETVYCSNRRKTANDSLGIMLVFDGTEWKTFDGTPLSSLVS